MFWDDQLSLAVSKRRGAMGTPKRRGWWKRRPGAMQWSPSIQLIYANGTKVTIIGGSHKVQGRHATMVIIDDLLVGSETDEP